MGNYASSGLFFMFITGHKYRQFRAGRNMTRTQLGWLSCKQKKDPEKGRESVHFCLICFREESVSASLISTPHWVMLPCLLNITSSLSISSFLVSISQVSHHIEAPSFSLQSSALWPYFSNCVHLPYRSEPWRPLSLPATLLHHIKGRVVTLQCFTSPWRWDTGYRKESGFPLPSVKVLFYFPTFTDISSIISRERNYCELPMLTVQDHSLNRLPCLP